MRPSNKKAVLLLDRNYYPIGAITWKRAMGKLYGGESPSETLTGYLDAVGGFDPAVIRLVSTVLPSHQMRRKPRLTRRAVFVRDDYECQYCGSKRISTLTIDHIKPRSRGGLHSFENLVTACSPCNQTKGSLLLSEWGRTLKVAPTTPNFGSFINQESAPLEWQQYIY